MTEQTTEAQDQDSDIFVPPQPGADPLAAIVRANPNNAAVQAATGDFKKAAELLKS